MFIPSKAGGDGRALARKQSKGTPLKVFSGKEATLNRVVLSILNKRTPMARYDMYLWIKSIKGFRHIKSKTIYRRMEVLEQAGWIVQKGSRPAKVKGESLLYGLTIKGRAALKLDEKSIEKFLNTATNERLAKLIDLI